MEKGERFFFGWVLLKVREVVLDLVVLGNYKEVGYKELGDVKGLIENYMVRMWSYRGED